MNHNNGEPDAWKLEPHDGAKKYVYLKTNVLKRRFVREIPLANGAV